MFMIEILHNEYLPLTRQNLSRCVPTGPGIYMLAVQLANGVHQIFFTSQTDDLYHSLRGVLRKDETHIPPIVMEYLKKYQCYFACFAMFDMKENIGKEGFTPEVNHSVNMLNVINCN
jgi:hypothetical protein